MGCKAKNIIDDNEFMDFLVAIGTERDSRWKHGVSALLNSDYASCCKVMINGVFYWYKIYDPESIVRDDGEDMNSYERELAVTVAEIMYEYFCEY